MGNNRLDIIHALWDRLNPIVDADFLYESRIHPLKSFGGGVFVKREDESGFGSSGSKRRKFASLIPHLVEAKVELVILIGGANSNHIVAAIQLLRQQDIPFCLFLKKAHTTEKEGNHFLVHLLESASHIHWIDTSAWSEVNQLAKAFGESTQSNWMVVPEGGMCKETVAGAASLMLDIERNESAIALSGEMPFSVSECFDHIWVDAGTGLSAACLVAMNALLQRESLVHVVMMADDEAYFAQVYEQVRSWLGEILELAVPPLSNCVIHYPVTARSFGSVNTKVLEAVRHFARTEGLLTDPIYTAKLFLTAQQEMASGRFVGTQLIIHSGGGTGLMGFTKKLERFL